MNSSREKQKKCLLSTRNLQHMLLPKWCAKETGKTQGAQGGPCPSIRSRDRHPLPLSSPPPLIHVNPPRSSVLHLTGLLLLWLCRYGGNVPPSTQGQILLRSRWSIPSRRSRVGPGLIPCHISGAPPRPQVGPTALPPLPLCGMKGPFCTDWMGGRSAVLCWDVGHHILSTNGNVGRML